MGIIALEGLEIYANHGVYSEEKENGQPFFVSVYMDVDFSAAASQDELSKTVNYADVAVLVKKIVTENSYDLIETVSEKAAKGIMHSYQAVKKVRVRVSKPEAPIGIKAKDIYVETERERHMAYLSIGSNMGDRKGYLDEAVSSLDGDDDISVAKVSKYYETEPYGYTDQPDFINAAVAIETILTPEELLDAVHFIENKCGRERTIHWGPRTLDIDILLYDEIIMNTETLTIPHQEMMKRQFVLEPMNEIAPWLQHPVTRVSIKEAFEMLDK